VLKQLRGRLCYRRIVEKLGLKWEDLTMIEEPLLGGNLRPSIALGAARLSSPQALRLSKGNLSALGGPGLHLRINFIP
jgi:hypothetical protein